MEEKKNGALFESLQLQFLLSSSFPSFQTLSSFYRSARDFFRAADKTQVCLVKGDKPRVTEGDFSHRKSARTPVVHCGSREKSQARCERLRSVSRKVSSKFQWRLKVLQEKLKLRSKNN